MTGWSRRARRPCTVVVADVWGARPVAATVAAALLVVHRVPGEVGVPGRSGIRALVWPLAPFALAVVVPGVLARQSTDLDRAGVRSRTGRRATVLLALVGAGLAVAVAAPGAMRAVLARNVVAVLALALVLSAVVPVAAAWASLLASALACWFVGAQPAGGEPPAWVLPYRSPPPALGTAAWAVALVVASLPFLAARSHADRRPEGNPS